MEQDEVYRPWWARSHVVSLASKGALLVAVIVCSYLALTWWERARRLQSVRALYDEHSFADIREPEPGDWLHEHDEPGQTFGAYLRERPNLATSERNIIYLQPIGNYGGSDAPGVDVLASFMEAYFGLRVRVLPVMVPGPGEVEQRIAEHSGEVQWLATDILDVMQERVPEDAYAVLGITEVDLWPGEGWNFVFGMARLRDRVGVHSIARYDPGAHGISDGSAQEDRKLLILRRSLKVVAHETGHMFGIRHCTHHMCVMNGSNSLDETDASPLHACPHELRKLEHAVGFDHVERYEALESFYSAHGLEREARWVRSRLDRVRVL